MLHFVYNIGRYGDKTHSLSKINLVGVKTNVRILFSSPNKKERSLSEGFRDVGQIDSSVSPTPEKWPIEPKAQVIRPTWNQHVQNSQNRTPTELIFFLMNL